MKYEDLTENQKRIFEQLEKFFVTHASVTVKDFVTVLGVLINKYKRR